MGRLEGRTARNAEPVDPAIGTTHMCQCIVECGLLTGTRSAEGIMASGHVNRINRPNTWLHRPTLRREDLTCQPGAVHTWHKADVNLLGFIPGLKTSRILHPPRPLEGRSREARVGGTRCGARGACSLDKPPGRRRSSPRDH